MWAGHMAQQIKVLTRKRECLGLNPRMQKKWKERRNYRKLCADLYICAVACDAHIHTYTYTKTT